MQRPTSAIVFGILNVVFGIMGLLGLVATAALLLGTSQSNNPALAAMADSPAYMAFLKITTPVGALMALALIAAGVGLFLVKNWARVLSLVYAIYAIVMGIVGAIVNFVFILGPMMEKMASQSSAGAAGARIGMIAGTVGSLFGLVYPALMLFFLTRPKLVAAFKPQPPPPIPTATV